AALPSDLPNILAAQAMFPVLNRQEMRGDSGDVDALGAPNELAQFGDSQLSEIWHGVMQRLLAIPEYVNLFHAAYPTTFDSQLGFQHAAGAIAAFELQEFTKTNSPFDHYLAREDAALTATEKRGALLFFGTAKCGSCHNGPLLGADGFANTGAPQLGPGMTSAAPLDFRLQQPLKLTAAEQSDLVAFLKSLTDPAARDLTPLVPARVPSGLAVP